MRPVFSTCKIDFTIFFKTALSPTLDWCNSESWDLFLSAYNSSERVRSVFDAVNAARKCWLLCPEYGYQDSERPCGDSFIGVDPHESDLIPNFFAHLAVDLSSGSICVDLTGFIRPHLLFLLRWLYQRGVKRFDALYSEPGHYKKKEQTDFSLGGIREVRQVAGFEGTHSHDTSRNLLIIGSGYDSLLIKAVAESKNNARKAQIFGLPSLRADMYQENIIRAHQAEDALGDSHHYFASAHDPFVTANLLDHIVTRMNQPAPLTNLYLSPLATKAQVLGFALYYFSAWDCKPASVIFPFSDRYERETTKGISRVWKYTVDLEAIRRSAITASSSCT
jgi:hypothetical protein